MIRSLIDFLKRDSSLADASQETIEDLAKKILKALNNDFLKKQLAEINRIDLEKWKEGIKRNYDPGNEFVLEWIRNNGREFHEQFQNSDCRICVKVYECSLAPKNACDMFNPELFDQSRYLAAKLIRLLEERKYFKPEAKGYIREFCKYYGIDASVLDNSEAAQ